MTAHRGPLTVGAVAYHPRVVTIWERFRAYFAEAGTPIDYVLYGTYEQLVSALISGVADIAWNTNTAFVAVDRRLGGTARILGMRDVDADFATVVVTRAGDAFERPAELAGRRLALGSRDCAHAAILPLHFLAQQGLDAARDCALVRFDGDIGKHGDTGGPELEVLRAVREGEADAGAIADAFWSQLRAQGAPQLQGLEIAWRSPTYAHCNFTALPTLDAERADAWRDALLAMSSDDPRMREAMQLEGVRRWLPGDRSGYQSLFDATAGAAAGAR